MATVESIFPANDFATVAESAGKEIEVGVILGYAEDGQLCVYAGGRVNGRQPLAKDILWLLESVKTKLINGDFSQ